LTVTLWPATQELSRAMDLIEFTGISVARSMSKLTLFSPTKTQE
jgi:hypothetical protein